MPYIFGKLWHLAIIWAIRKAFQCILQGVRFLLANHTRLSPTSENDSYAKISLQTDLEQLPFPKNKIVGWSEGRQKFLSAAPPSLRLSQRGREQRGGNFWRKNKYKILTPAPWRNPKDFCPSEIALMISSCKSFGIGSCSQTIALNEWFGVRSK